MLEVVADASFLTAPVSCEVSNAVGSANRSTALDVQCELGRGCGCGQSETSRNEPRARVGRCCHPLWKKVGWTKDVDRVWLCWVSAKVKQRRGEGEGGARACERCCGLGAYTRALEGALFEWLLPGPKLSPSSIT